MIYLNYIKYGIVLLAVGALVWFVKDYQDKAEFKKNTEANALWQERFDSLRVSYTVLNDEQMMAYIKNNDELKAVLKENNIKSKRVTSVLEHILKYRDTTIVETDLSSVLDAINQNKDFSQPFKDSTSCLIVKGEVKYRDGVLAVEVNDRIFTGKTVAVGYVERRQWSFLGVKSRFLGKKQATIHITDKCGESTIISVERKK